MDYLQVMLLSALALMLTLLTPVNSTKTDRFTSCLPEGIKLTSEIFEDSNGLPNAKSKPKTLRRKLTELRARCKNRKLVTHNGKEIRIVQLIGCWGNPPEDYQEQLDRQQRELKQLKDKYVLIQIPCTSSKTIAGFMSDMRLSCRERVRTETR